MNELSYVLGPRPRHETQEKKVDLEARLRLDFMHGLHHFLGPRPLSETQEKIVYLEA